MSNEIDKRLDKLEDEIRQARPNIQKLEAELRVFRVEIAPLIKAYSENQSAMRRLFWSLIGVAVMALGSMGVISFIVKHSAK